MTSPHLSERALQEAAESLALLPATQAAHLRGCHQCQDQVATYQHLFVATTRLPQPAFAFDLTASVLAQLPKTKPAFPWVLCWVAVPVVGVVGAFLALFGSTLIQAFQDMATLLGGGLLVVVGFLMAGQCVELLAQYRRQMRLLSFS